jgi:hypothetical protein
MDWIEKSGSSDRLKCLIGVNLKTTQMQDDPKFERLR